ncbi:hypothetical protein AMECASPLE_034393 [Ameca splendens]|uniref:Uncharacterized protein n=1 Tax=Ameca splendens TaxID=208324 RepID=A0ABV0ZFX0_9TELE
MICFQKTVVGLSPVFLPISPPMPDHFFALPQRSSSFHDQLIVYDPVSVATSMILAKHLLDQAFRECSFACLLIPPRLASSLLVGLLFSASSVYEPILKTISV